MKRDFMNELSPEIRERAKKNLVYVAIFSIVMLFAGFTSAYIVSMGDSFWLKYPMPVAFWVSTTVIVLSSLFYELGIRAVKKNNQSGLRLFMALTLLCGLGFVYFQFRGYGDLMDKGAHPINNHIIVTDGRYGDYYEVKYKGSFIQVDGNKFYLNGREMSRNEMEDYQKFMSQFLKIERNESIQVTSYGDKFVLYYNSQPVGLINGKLCTTDGKELQYVDMLRLRDLAINVKDGRGDFFVRGELGKDFHIFYKGKELEYVNRELRLEGRKLSKYLQIKAMETADTASSYLYLITILHLLHIAGTIIYLMKMTTSSFSGRFNSENYLSLKLGAIFWHFLGLLWIYLLLFLLFIH